MLVHWSFLMSSKIITICGSTKFKSDFERVNKMLTLEGYIVLSVGCFIHCDSDTISEEQKKRLDSLHLEKIEMSDEIYVINKDGYIGQSTANEIKFAMSLDKKINYLEDSELPFYSGFDG